MMERKCVDAYVRNINKISLLSPEESNNLIKLSRKGDVEARNKLIESNLRLVLKIANSKRYRQYYSHLGDLIQEGNIGLMRAIEKFDVRRDNKFSTYAVFWIHQHIGRYLVNRHRLIRIPAYQEEIFHKVKKSRENYEEKHHHSPSLKELSELIKMGIKPLAKTIRAMTVLEDHSSFDENEETFRTNEFTKYSPEVQLMRNAMQKDMRNLLELLSPKEKKIIELRFGLGFHRYTLKDAGEYCGLTKERVRIIEKNAINKLRRHHRKIIDYKSL